MGPSFDVSIPWWVLVLFGFYTFVICFGIGAFIGFVVGHVLMSALSEKEGKQVSRLTWVSVTVLCAIFGGFMNLAVVIAFV